VAHKLERTKQLAVGLQDVDKEIRTYKSLSPKSETAISRLENATKKG
jgi:hypothetical protein